MFSTVASAALCGIRAEIIHVEADVGDGLPVFQMVGSLSAQVREAAERVRTAMKNSGLRLSPKKITVNLSPADIYKDGSAYDLPVAVAVLASYGYIPQEALKGLMAAGELSLNGEVCPVRGILPMARRAVAKGCRRFLLPVQNAAEGAVIEGIEVIGVRTLREVIDYLNGLAEIKPTVSNIEEMLQKFDEKPQEDFRDLNGQEDIRRAAEVAACGMHNLLMTGPPGSGKSMVARRIPGILPKLTLEECLEISEIYSVAGLLGEGSPLITRRPFRAPHHTISAQALAGGGRIPRPGEVSLAHRSVLFLDELPEFRREAMEILRQPMEEREIRISRTGGNFIYPANCMVVAAMNPCKCGYYPDLNRCTCTPSEVHRYQGRISRPLLDRFDICVEVQELSYQDLSKSHENESSAAIRERVLRAHRLQQERYHGTPFHFNSDINVQGVKEFCPLGTAESRMMEDAFEKLSLSARGYHRILKVARTIADLDASQQIQCRHIGEALCYRAVELK